MLQENTLFGVRDKEQIAIERLKSFNELAIQNNPNGFYVCDSGGKDSMVITWLCWIAGVKFEIYHNHTTADHLVTVRHVRALQKWWQNSGINYTISYPYHKGERTSIWKLIPIKGLPTRLQRWCCEIFKEHGGEGRYAVTGVRWAESTSRKKRGAFETFTPNKKDKIILNNDNDFKRRMTEFCTQKGKVVINPIIDWTDDDVWEFIKKYLLPTNPLYSQGYSRVGCVGCPMSTKQFKELENNPKYKNMYLRAIERYLKNREEKGLQNADMWETPEKCYLWWTEQIKKENVNENQVAFEDLEEV